MKCFQDEIRRLANARIPDESALDSLLAAWNRTFLNYTETAPDQWTDPNGEYSGDFSRADVAIPFLRLLCATPGGIAGYRDVVQGYIEFFAAVWKTDSTPAERRRMLDFLEDAAPQMSDVSAYVAPLADALRKSVAE